MIECKKITKVEVISCYHNSILTPIRRYADCQEYLLKKGGKVLLFKLLKSKIISGFLEILYISKWRRKFKKTYNSSDATVLLCDGQLDELKKMCGMNNMINTYVIPNCIPEVNICLRPKKNNVVWAGKFDYYIKRPDLMLLIWEEVMRNHHEWTLYMLGDGPSLEDMKQIVKKKNIKNVVFAGRVNPDKYYEEAKIQCVTSVHESFGLVSVEAMQRENPVIAFNSYTAAPFVISNNVNGILIEPFNTKEYAKQLSNLMNDDERCRKMGIAAQDSIMRFSEEKVFNMWDLLFDKIRYGN